MVQVRRDTNDPRITRPGCGPLEAGQQLLCKQEWTQVIGCHGHFMAMHGLLVTRTREPGVVYEEIDLGKHYHAPRGEFPNWVQWCEIDDFNMKLKQRKELLRVARWSHKQLPRCLKIYKVPFKEHLHTYIISVSYLSNPSLYSDNRLIL